MLRLTRVFSHVETVGGKLESLSTLAAGFPAKIEWARR